MIIHPRWNNYGYGYYGPYSGRYYGSYVYAPYSAWNNCPPWATSYWLTMPANQFYPATLPPSLTPNSDYLLGSTLYSPYLYGGEIATVTVPEPEAAEPVTALPGEGRVSSSSLVFRGYAETFVEGKTLAAPFAPYGATPPFIAAEGALTAPWAYEGGRDAVAVAPWEDSDPYIRADERRAVALRAALNDLTRLWKEEDVRALRRRVADEEPVAVFRGDTYLYTLRPDALTPLLVDLQENLETVSFRVTDVQRRTDGLMTAHARHEYRVRGASEKDIRTQDVDFTLVYRDGTWLLTGLSLPSAADVAP